MKSFPLTVEEFKAVREKYNDMGYLEEFMKLAYLQETTTVWMAKFSIPLHIYIFTPKGSLIGYIPEGTEKVHFFVIPIFSFSKKGRTFVKVNIGKVAVV